MSKEMLGGCCVCSDDRGWPENPLVYCDGQGCNVAVHQACYGIVTVPSGPWFCRKCELQERPRCELCPSKEGAFKKTDQNSWAHVVCALYIPEVRFGNVTTMEPILISLIPQERFNKTCYICEESTRGASKANYGACMQCNKAGCRSTFHVTCAQMLGLLCEEAGNMMDNVKYCGYCQHHYAKLKATRHVKIIPPYRPVPSNNSRSVSPAASPDKSTHGQTTKSSGGSSASAEDAKTGSTSTPAHSGPGTTPQTPSGEGGKTNNNISPDINSSCSSKTNNKNAGKKGSSYHGASGNKTANTNLLDNKNGNTTSAPHDSNKTDVKGKGHGHAKNTTPDSDHTPARVEDNLTVKLERLEEKGAGKPGFCNKKDFSTIQLKEVVTAALDRPITNSPGSKFDHSSSSLTSGLDGPSSSITPTGPSSHGSGRHSHGHTAKLAPPDIKPDVTLTPIPMKPNSSTRHSSSKDEERELGDRETVSLSKSPGANLPFHHSFGAPPKLQNQQVSPDISEAASSKGNKPPELTQEDIPPLDKTSSGPPSKRARYGVGGMSRDDERERELRRTPTKGRGGRRGSTTGSYSRRGDATSAVAFVDDSSFDEIIEANGSTTNGSTESSTRGGRQAAGRKNGTAPTISTRSSNSNALNALANATANAVTPSSKPAEDPPAPTLSQLAKSGQIGGETPPVGLAPHMFGNALNPSSSMAMKMVDTLSEEMEAVVAAGGVPEVVAPVQTPLVGISLPGVNKPTGATTGNSQASSSSSTSSAIVATPQTLEQLLERQWEQGSQFLMEQAQHLDIAQLLSCLNQLKQDNKALEEHVQSLIQRRDQLTAINARLNIPLGSSSALGSLGGAFLGGGVVANTNAHHNGYSINQSTPSPNVHPHSHGPPGQGGPPKNHPVANPAPSPQQHDHVAASHGRERNNYNLSDLPSGRAELVVTHSSQGGGMHPGHPNHGPPPSHASNHRSQMMNSSYNSYGSHPVPVVTSLSSPHSHQPNHPPSRDGR